MGIDDLDYKQREALREEATHELDRANAERLEIVLSEMDVPEEHNYAVARYLMVTDQNLLIDIHQSGVFNSALFYAVWKAGEDLKNIANASFQEPYGRMAAIESPFNMDKFVRIQTDLVVTHDVLSISRSTALLARQTGVDNYRDLLDKYFIKELIKSHLDSGEPIPESFSFFPGINIDGAINEWHKEQQIHQGFRSLARDEKIVKFQTEAEELGSHPRFAARRAEVKYEQNRAEILKGLPQRIERKHQELIERMKAYPDPRLFIDYALELKDGKLPV